MGNLLTYIREEDEMRERFVAQAFTTNPNIKDLGEFEDALLSGFATEKGRNASRWFNDEVIMELFDSQENRNKISSNISNEEFQRIFNSDERPTPQRQQQQVTIQIQKAKVKSYNRNGVEVKAYDRTFKKWSTAEAKFLSVRKSKKLTPKQIVSEYNAHFKDNPRTTSSIKTKVHRL